jgi:FSR family fosmidomycin resistance protein-like MFS transporter
MAASSPPSEARFDPQEKQVLVFTGVAHLLTHYIELTYPTLAVILAAEVGLPIEQVLGWSLAGYLLFGLGALPAGLVADRVGGKRVVLAGMLLAGLSLLAAAVSEPGWPLAVCLAGMGLGVSAYHPAGIGLISRAVRARGAALGINGIYGNVGIAFAPLATSVLAGAVGWRWTLAITGFVVLAVTTLGAVLPFQEPAPVKHDDAHAEASRIPGRQIAAFAILCVAAMLGGISYRANTLAQPALFAERIPMLDFGLAASLAMLVGIAGQYIGGRVADRFPLGWGYLFFHAASLPMLVLICMSFGLPLLVSASLFVFFALGMQPIENSLFASLTPDRWRSTAFGMKFSLTFGVGSGAVYLVRWVAESRGFIGVYYGLMVVVALIVVAGLTLVWIQRKALPYLAEPATAPQESG